MNSSVWPRSTSIIRILSILCLISPHGFAENETPPPATISLREVIHSALESNLGLQLRQIDPLISETSVEESSAVYDPEIFASAQIAQSEQARTLSATTPTSRDSRYLQTGVRKTFVTGTQITAQTNLSRQDSNEEVDSDYSPLRQNADFSLSLRQPLLRNFGGSQQRWSVLRAEAGLTAAKASFQADLIDLLSQTEKAYWQLSAAIHQMALRQTSLDVARSLLRETEARANAGLATQVDILQARASLATREEEIIEAERIRDNAADTLLQLINSLSEDAENATGLNVTEIPDDELTIPDFRQWWDLALVRNPSLQVQESNIQQVDFDRRIARNNLRPDLDLVMNGGYSGVDDRKSRQAIDNALDRDGNEWSIGLEFSIPWGSTGEKARLRRSELRLDQENIRLLEIRQQLLAQTRSAFRNLNAKSRSLEAAVRTLELREATFAQERSKYANGISTFREVLESQQELDSARIRHLDALYQRVAAEIDLEAVSGTLTERHGIAMPL